MSGGPVSERPRVVFLRPLFNPVAEEILGSEVDIVEGWKLPAQERADEIARAHGIVGHASADDVARGTHLKVIASGASGFDGIPVDAATAAGIAVVNAAGSHYTAISEHAVGLMLALSRRIAYCDRVMHAQARSVERTDLLGHAWPGWPTQLQGKTLGLIGFGFIGRDLAHKCRSAFSMRVLAFDPYFDANEAARQGVEIVGSVAELLPRCDYVSLQLPLTPETRGLIGAGELALMKPSAVLVNVSRGPTVDTAALVDALRAGVIAGAGLDVFDPEPLPEGHALYGLDNVVLTPHIGGWTFEAVEAVAASTARDVLRVLRGERPRQLVNPEVWPTS